jgi:PPK2 family polyphosphate:nucleotide phosphotransferase
MSKHSFFIGKSGLSKGIHHWPTRIKPPFSSDEEAKGIEQALLKELSALQSLLMAQNQYSLLIIFQGMDTAGKDSAIKHVMSGVNPQGCQVTSFKHPSFNDLQHDFLWRCQTALPERGRIGIFNRSYYEETLVVRVHPEVLAQERLPKPLLNDPKIWRRRFADIVNYETYLTHSGTIILKFFLHISKDEQRTRLLARLEDPTKHWKFDPNDIKERESWKAYQKAYGDCLKQTSSETAPWYAIPSDDKTTAHILISQVIIKSLKALNLRYPQPDPKREAQLKKIHRKLKNSEI